MFLNRCKVRCHTPSTVPWGVRPLPLFLYAIEMLR